MLKVEIANRQSQRDLDEGLLRRVVRHVLHAKKVGEARISLAFVEDAAIEELHQRFLQLEGPTDVLTFPLSEVGQPLEGEIVVNVQEAIRAAARFGWSDQEELLLYVVHGLLHLCGYVDHSPQKAATMQRRQSELLRRWGMHPTYEERAQPMHENKFPVRVAIPEAASTRKGCPAKGAGV